MANIGAVEIVSEITGYGNRSGDVILDALFAELDGVALAGIMGNCDIELDDDSASVEAFCGGRGEILSYQDFEVESTGTVHNFGDGEIDIYSLVSGSGSAGFLGTGEFEQNISISSTASWSVSVTGNVDCVFAIAGRGRGSGVYDDLVLRYVR
jgi:hypothetical protein